MSYTSIITSCQTGGLAGLSIYNALSGHIELAAFCGGIAVAGSIISIRFAMEEITNRARPHLPKTSSPAPQNSKPPTP